VERSAVGIALVAWVYARDWISLSASLESHPFSSCAHRYREVALGSAFSDGFRASVSSHEEKQCASLTGHADVNCLT
jgi:hypothetical protein